MGSSFGNDHDDDDDDDDDDDHESPHRFTVPRTKNNSVFSVWRILSFFVIDTVVFEGNNDNVFGGSE